MMLRTSASIVVLFALHAACSAPPADISFRDLNKNGKLDVYEDVTQTVDARIDDLLSQMSVAEKAGLMFINISIVNDDASLEYVPGSGPERLAPLPNIDERKLNHFNVGKIPDDPAVFAQWQNNLQRYAEMNTRLGADYGTSDRAVAEVLLALRYRRADCRSNYRRQWKRCAINTRTFRATARVRYSKAGSALPTISSD